MTPRPLVGHAALGRPPDPTIGLGMSVNPGGPAAAAQAQRGEHRRPHCGRMLAGMAGGVAETATRVESWADDGETAICAAA